MNRMGMYLLLGAAALLPASCGDSRTVLDNEPASATKELETRVAQLEDRAREAERLSTENRQLRKEVQDLKAKLESIEAAMKTLHQAEAQGATGSEGVTQQDFEKMVEAREARQREQEMARREKDRADRTAKNNAAIIENMDKELSLSVAQKEEIAKLLDEQTRSMNNLVEKGNAARDKGEEFDWRKEMKAIADKSFAAVRAELTPGQQTKFDATTEIAGLNAYAPKGSGPSGR